VAANRSETGTVYGRLLGIMYGTSRRISYGPSPALAARVITVSRTKTQVIVSRASAKARKTSPIT
jgi:hypothetical protein